MGEINGRFAGKSVVVTGVAKTNGIGFGTACVFAQEGAELAIVDIGDAMHDCGRRLRELGCAHVTCHTADLMKAAQVQRMADEVLAQHDKVDVLVNNAGLFHIAETLDVPVNSVECFNRHTTLTGVTS